MVDVPKKEHAYDGIEEYDNPLPGWWKWLVVLTVVFSPFYWLYFHSGAAGRSLEEQYGAALAANTRLQFAEMGDLDADSETILRATTKKSWLQVGKVVFKTNCISCHGQNGEGIVGPNLTDGHYKNVRNIEDLALVVAKGAGGNAMPAWENRMHANEIVLVAAYVASLRDTNVDGGKGPEGQEIAPWPEPPAEEEAEEESAESPSEASE